MERAVAETQGILYIAAGAKYIRAAVRSAETVRKHSPGLAIHLYADWPAHGFDFGSSPAPFTSVATIDRPHRRSKVDLISRTPFDRTLYLDTDTALNADVRDVFRVLDRFDLALCHAHRRNTPDRLAPWRLALPRAFPQYNGGVILFKRSASVMAFLEEWRRAFHEAGFNQDQRTLRELLWLSDLRFAALPPEYNVRFIKYHFLWSRTEAATQLFHLRRYHDGPFWFATKWIRALGRPFVRRGLDPRAFWPSRRK
jgi:hypothetical protein